VTYRYKARRRLALSESVLTGSSVHACCHTSFAETLRLLPVTVVAIALVIVAATVFVAVLVFDNGEVRVGVTEFEVCTVPAATAT
jgi:hypothetical protein